MSESISEFWLRKSRSSCMLSNDLQITVANCQVQICRSRMEAGLLQRFSNRKSVNGKGGWYARMQVCDRCI